MTIVRILLTIAALISLTSLQVSYGVIICEKLPVEVCAFSVSSSGARCLLEKSILRDGSLQYECQRSDVMAENMNELIETEECMNACGVERMTVGLSTDTLEERGFIKNLCSPRCYNNCPNIIDLYYNLAAGEGVYLPRVCEAHRSGDRRMTSEFISPAVAPVAPIIFGNPPISPVMAPSPSFS
eukprot:PITA_22330